MDTKIVKVSRNTKPRMLAGAIAKTIETENIELHTIGAASVNQAVKAVAIARGFLAPRGICIMMIPSFGEIEIDDRKVTGIRFMLKNQRG